jgi:hypothetical protein
MKRVYLFIAVSILAISSLGAQSMSSFFRETGVRRLAAAAHPTNTYSRGEYEVSDNFVRVKIWYDEGYITELKIKREGNFFTEITVVSDNDWAIPFFVIGTIKDMVFTLINEEENEGDEDPKSMVQVFEKTIRKTVGDMTGKDLACLMLTLGWMAY